MVKYQTINSVYLIIGGFVLVFIAIYISICVYCFLKVCFLFKFKLNIFSFFLEATPKTTKPKIA